MKRLCQQIPDTRAVAIAIFMLQAIGHAEIAYHIAPNGNDVSGNGSLAKPWKSIAAARDSFRRSGANTNMQEDITVNLHGGRYEIHSTLEFTSADSGSNGHNVTYRAFPGAQAVVSGGKRVSGWSQVPGKPYWVAAVPTSAGFADYFRQLYVNGIRAERARSNWITGVSYFDAPGTPQAIDGICFNAVDLKNYENIADLRLFHISSFKVDEFPVIAIIDDAAKGLKKVQLQQPYCQIRYNRGEKMFEANDQWMFVQAVEELDEPGEWALNRTTRQVFYYPNPFEDMGTAEIYAPQVETLVRFTGSSASNKVRNIIMKNLIFEHGNWLFPRDYFIGGGQAEILYRGVPPTSADPGYSHEVPGQIVLDHTCGIQFLGNTIRHQASCGIQPRNGARDTRIEGNIFYDLTGAAVIGGRWGGRSTTLSNPEICENTVVSNNVIRNIGGDFMAASLVNNLQHKAFQVIHNDMADAPYMGFHQRNAKSTIATSTGLGNTVVSFNRISLANTAARYGVGDGGYIYTYGIWPDSLIRGNDIRGINGANANVSGFYLDNQSYGIRVESNLMRDVRPGMMGYKFVRSLDDDLTANSAIGNWGDSSVNWFQVVSDAKFHQLTFGARLPAEAESIANAAGLQPGYRNLLNQIYAPTNLARGKLAKASSQWKRNTPPGAALDHNYASKWHQAAGDPLAWWSVDLGEPHVIQRLEIAARTDLDQPDARRNFQVQASNASNYSTFTVLAEQNEIPFAYRKPGFSNSWIRFIGNPNGFRYLRVIKTAKGSLNFSEFQAYGYRTTNNGKSMSGDNR